MHYCPVADDTLRGELRALTDVAHPLSFGLERAECFVGYDRDVAGRRESASGGVLTRLAAGLLDRGEVDAVVHARRVASPVGFPHYAACVSRSVDEVKARRSSIYGPVSYSGALGSFKRHPARLAITGVPCVLRGLRRLFDEHPHFHRSSVVLLGLACSHNVNGQFTDFLAESLGLGSQVAFEARLRDKCGIPSADHFNTCFTSGERVLVRQNRHASLFTSLWRGHAFALEACHYCPDFWARAADVTVKDAWGQWAADPLGLSIVAVRSPEIGGALRRDASLSLEPLSREDTAMSQEATSTYKLVQVRDRFEQSAWSTANRRSGFLANQAIARISRRMYRTFGFRLTRVAVLALLGRGPSGLRFLETELTPPLRAALSRVLPEGSSRVVLFGAGSMAEQVTAALGDRVASLVDNDPSKQGGTWANRAVGAPQDLVNLEPGTVVLLTSLYSVEMAQQIAQLGLDRRLRVIDVRPIYDAVSRRRARRTRVVARLNAMCGTVRARSLAAYRKILVVGGYGYRNTGDEAQLNANLVELRHRFPTHLVKVLTPDPPYTHVEHHACAVGEAPRLAFYDAGSSPVYGLSTLAAKTRFLWRSAWIYVNAWLVRFGCPTVLLGARRSALLYELSTADLVYYSGGGYLTGSTLSRLWDGAFFMAFARVLKVPVVLSGQTIGLWNSRFSRRLASWALRHATVVGTRDESRTLAALAGIRVDPSRIVPGCDDALFCERERDVERMSAIRRQLQLGENDQYVALNVHYWGLGTASRRQWLLDRVARAVAWLQQETNLRVRLVPMFPTDREAMDDLAGQRPDLDLVTLDYNYDFRVARAVIAGSEVCVTMKHHPIVFALGEGVPAVSLALSEYYHHKNGGALGLFGLETLNVRLDDDDWLERFCTAFGDAWSRRAEIASAVSVRLAEFRRGREQFWRRVTAACHGGRA